MKIIEIKYDPSTISTPAFLDVYTEDGERYTYTGKLAKRLYQELKVGEDLVVKP